MSLENEADILDIVKRLRQFTNALDNVHWLADKLELLQDPALTTMANRTMGQIDEAGAQSANLLKHVEGSKAYRDIVKKYKAPTGVEDGQN